MIVYRLAKTVYSHDLSGKGAQKAGGRWNSRGVSMVYTSESRALCTAEIAVHMPLGILPDDYHLITIEIPDHIKIFKILPQNLAPEWKAIPHSGITQELGDAFIKAGIHVVMKAPSAVVPGDSNYLINPDHPDAKMIQIAKVEPFTFDQRMFLK
ncbi:MAG: RES family NAD+ phosphorylase [Bacteroidetes bacterium]|nr:RES family NAD+ phosphorylase [Bacteroidota bacterium]